jgi:hypothetical protein
MYYEGPKKIAGIFGKGDQMDIAVIVSILVLGIFITIINLWFGKR